MPRTTDTGPSGADAVPRSVERVLDLLEIVVTAGSANLTAIATAADLTPTTALRYLRALDARGYVARDDTGHYSPGPTVLRLAAGVRDAGFLDRLVAVAQPVLDALAVDTGESAYLAIADGDHATYVATADGPRAIRHVGWVGQEIPLAGTAVGAALASPGATFTRTGAVDPDITAISRSLPTMGSHSAAVSVVGPQHRLRGRARRDAEAALERSVEAIAARLSAVTARGAVAS